MENKSTKGKIFEATPQQEFENKEQFPLSGEVLSVDRTRMAADRTLMAWLRTSLSMISFGFTLYKFLQAFEGQNPVLMSHPNAPRNAGLSLIGIGTFALIMACIQHEQYLRKLHLDAKEKQLDLSLIVACLIILMGLLMLWSIILNSGPFS
jgi:putative membrane protein